MDRVTKSASKLLPKVKKSKLPYCFFVLLAIILSITVNLIFCFQKQGYHVDEIYSYGLANSYYKPFLDSHDRSEASPEFVSNEYYKNYVSTNNSSKFNYDSVVYNQEHDVHPPLFYLVLHTICSFFPGNFSKWFGLSINIACLAVTLIVLLLITRLLTKNKFIHVASILLYGLSTGAICTTTYIRMYALLTMFTSIYAYIHVKMIVKKQQSVGNLFLLSIITFLGFFTQYYFIIFAAIMSFLYMIRAALSKNWKNLAKYVIAITIPLVAMLLIYPAAYTTILGVNKSLDGFNHASYALRNDYSLADAIVEFVYFLNRQLFSCLLTPIIIIVCIALITKTLFNAYHITESSRGLKLRKVSEILPREIFISYQSLSIIVLITTSLLYFIVVAKITYIKADRYLFCIYPILTVTFLLVVNWILNYIFSKHQIIQYATLASLLAILLSLQYTVYLPKGSYPDTLYASDAVLNNYMLANTNSTCIYIYGAGNEWGDTTLLPWLRQCNGGIYKINSEDVTDYISDNNIANSSPYTVFIDKSINKQSNQKVTDEVVNLLLSETGAKSKKYITTIDENSHWSTPTTVDVIKLE